MEVASTQKKNHKAISSAWSISCAPKSYDILVRLISSSYNFSTKITSSRLKIYSNLAVTQKNKKGSYISRADLFWTKNDLCTNGSVSDEDLVVYIKRCRSMMPIQVITNMRWNIYTLVYSNRRTAALKYPRNLFWSKIDSISRLKLDPRYPKLGFENSCK